MTGIRFLHLFTLCLGCLVPGFCYKPVILMHGVFPNKNEMTDLKNWIGKVHPGTNITLIKVFDTFFSSIEPLWRQTKVIREQMRKVMQRSKDGVHLLCYSQGGLICRAVLQTLPDHNVDTFLSLSCPLAGQYGDTNRLKYLFPHYLKENLYKLFYTSPGQEFSVGNYWNDPHHHDLYLQYSVFLAILNNQTYHPHSHEYRKNFLRLKKMVLIGGPDDNIIMPWQSSQFGFYDKKESVLNYKKQEWYKKDSFGLRTLEQRGGLSTYTIPGVMHVHWHSNRTVFDCCIEKWLT